MKKIIQRTALCLVILAVIVATAITVLHTFGYEDLFSKETSAETTTTEETTTETTTAPETTSEVNTLPGETVTMQEPVVDFSDFSVIDVLPLSLASGSWDVRHCQGIAVDKQKGYIYYSYTHTFVKCDFAGNVMGTIININGHLGDICFNEEDGKIYASLLPPGKKALYVAIIDVDNLEEINLDAVGCGLVRTVHIHEIWNDRKTLVKFDNMEYTQKYGISGLDGVCFGPSFNTGEGNYLTIGCGMSTNTQRKDNDYQVLLQYDVEAWWNVYAKPLSRTEYHHSGPYTHNGKFFVYTGRTTSGIQTMTYFDEMNVWLLFVYKTRKDNFNKYTLFVVDGDIKPYKAELIGQPEPDEQYVLTLYPDGDFDKKNNIYGWYANQGNKGIEYMGGGLFYIVHPFKTWYETQTAVAYLYVWDPEKESPFSLAAGIGNDYTISKKITVTTTNPQITNTTVKETENEQ